MAKHCWMGRLEHAEETYGPSSDEALRAFDEPGTCMLPDGHAGPHEFTPDDQITITFAPVARRPRNKK